jgi:hypothetical protein
MSINVETKTTIKFTDMDGDDFTISTDKHDDGDAVVIDGEYGDRIMTLSALEIDDLIAALQLLVPKTVDREIVSGDRVKCILEPDDTAEDERLLGMYGVVIDKDHYGFDVRWEDYGHGWGEDNNRWWVNPESIALAK